MGKVKIWFWNIEGFNIDIVGMIESISFWFLFSQASNQVVPFPSSVLKIHRNIFMALFAYLLFIYSIFNFYFLWRLCAKAVLIWDAPWSLEELNQLTQFLFQKKLSGDDAAAFCSIWVLERYIYTLPNILDLYKHFTQHCMLIYYLCSFIYLLLDYCFKKFRTLRIKELQYSAFSCVSIHFHGVLSSQPIRGLKGGGEWSLGCLILP